MGSSYTDYILYSILEPHVREGRSLNNPNMYAGYPNLSPPGHKCTSVLWDWFRLFGLSEIRLGGRHVGSSGRIYIR